MGKKKLLNEGTITRFMKLAAINENAAEAFVGSIHEQDDEELVDDEVAAGAELAGDEVVADDELVDDEVAAEGGTEGGTEGVVKDMVDAVVGAISGVADDHGVQVDLDVQGGDDDELDVGAELDADAELAGEEEPDLELESQVRSIVAEMLNEDDEDLYEDMSPTGREDVSLSDRDGPESGKKQSFKDRRKDMRGARRATGEDTDPVPTQESHGRGSREYAKDTGHRTTDRNRASANESIQIVDDGILVQEVTNRVFTRLRKMLNERKKTR